MGVNEVALGLTIGIAAFTDWRNNKIYNLLLFPAFLIALILHMSQGGIAGLLFSLEGAAIGFLLLLFPYLLGGMGAGDVKFLSVIGAFGGVHFVIGSFLYGAVIGALISIGLLLRNKALLQTLKHFLGFLPIFPNYLEFNDTTIKARREKFPYGIALASGTLILMLLSRGGGWL